MGVGCRGKWYGAVHEVRDVWVSVTVRYMGVKCLGKWYGALHGGGVSR